MSGVFFVFQAEDGIRDAQESRGLGDVYKRQGDGGFGYDKIFYPNDSQTSMASITPELKNTISHRAIAARSFLIELEKN